MAAYKPKNGGTRIVAFIAPEMHESLRAIAFAESRSISGLIKQAVEDLVNAKPDYILQELTKPRS